MIDELDQLRDMWATATPAEQQRIAALAAEIKNERRPLIEWAVHYAGRGIPVFPCGHNKRPRIPKDEGGNGFHDATLDTDQIREWWTRWPNAAIGTPTGRTFSVLDVDTPNGYDSIDNNHIEDGRTVRQWAESIAIARVTTPTGGAHYYLPPDTVDTGTAFLHNVDARGEGGYVILPPSRTNDGRYTWAFDNIGIGAPA